MNRRDAIKQMGLIAGGFMLSAIPVSLSSCSKMKKRIILYYTATGNSLYVARQLADDNTQLLSIPQLIKENRYDIEADEIGLVYPVYGHMPPGLVWKYLEKSNLKAPYIFAVATYGNRKCNAVEILDDIARKNGKTFDYIATIVMVDNWLPNFDMNEQMKIDKKIPENLTRIKSELAEQKHWHEPVTEEERQIHNDFMQRSGRTAPFVQRSEEEFVIHDNCIGCGICTHVCPKGNYAFTSEGIKTQGDCDFCFACIQNCPQKAISFARITEVNPNARYRNEHISLMDIKRANNQSV